MKQKAPRKGRFSVSEAGQQAEQFLYGMTRAAMGGYGEAPRGHIMGEGTIQFPDIAEVKTL